ncbi:unnamed protein product [Adineta ricciae]|uniref:Uncharacterized protein n=1 Tax=Adineta ricciae TaxID=249248 RepID=A0A813QTP4_ADIRI|nr:unnamed protein product [Adineta ricciae]
MVDITSVYARLSTSAVTSVMPFLCKLITFSLGVYAGIYACQNYETPKVQSPAELYGRAKQYLESKKKPSE